MKEVKLPENFKPFISSKTNAFKEMDRMINADFDLYDKCISTVGFAYGFSQVCNRALWFDEFFRLNPHLKMPLNINNDDWERGL